MFLLNENDPQWDEWVHRCDVRDAYHFSAYASQMNDKPGSYCNLLVYESDRGLVVHPLVFQPCRNKAAPHEGFYDVFSSYGYGGPAWSAKNGDLDLLKQFWKEEKKFLLEKNVISRFVRINPLVNQYHAADPEVYRRQDVIIIDLLKYGTTNALRMSTNHRRKLKLAAKSGLSYSFAHAPSDADIATFVEMYNTTMIRLSADERYMFTFEKIKEMFAGLPEKKIWLGMAKLETKPTAIFLFLRDEDKFHYHLGSSNELGRACGGNHGLMHHAALFAKELDCEKMLLGGGFGGNEGLFRFKKGFGGAEIPYYTKHSIINETVFFALYNQKGMSEQQAIQQDYFPPYAME